MIKASGRTAVILATGLLVCFASVPLASAASDDSGAKTVKRQNAHQSHGKTTRPSDDQAQTSKAKASDSADVSGSAPLPAGVANANAEMPTPENPAAASASAMTARASDITQAASNQPAADAQVVAPDQLNDVDRALRDDPPPAPKPVAMVSTETPAAATTHSVASSEGSAWDQSSLIGKIFIGFGAFLTVASAARMFIA
jgi:hypothetical protein